ncbi:MULTISPECIES: hypothetical protein [Serratia]|nr:MULTISPECIES: hypothetical protein [Serratia]WBF47007.1 hypothetical protein OLD77_08165 [Serratia rubidaea]
MMIQARGDGLTEAEKSFTGKTFMADNLFYSTGRALPLFIS